VRAPEGEVPPIRRELGTGDLRVAEEDLAVKERRQAVLGGGSGGCEERQRGEQRQDAHGSPGARVDEDLEVVG
jgi:hypothetical protein